MLKPATAAVASSPGAKMQYSLFLSCMCISNRCTDLRCTQRRIHAWSNSHRVSALYNIYFKRRAMLPHIKRVKFLRSHREARTVSTMSKYLQLANVNAWLIPMGSRVTRVATDLSSVISSVISELFTYVHRKCNYHRCQE